MDKPDHQSGDTMVVSVNARTAGKLTINVLRDRLLTTQTADVNGGTSQARTGPPGPMVATLRRPLDVAAQRMPGRAIGINDSASTGPRAPFRSISRRRNWCDHPHR